jgi:hypothetical protein
MRLQRTTRNGNVVVLVAVCLTVILGFVAFALDGGVLLDDRQRAQSAGDAAALAAAEKLFLNWQRYQGLDVDGSAALAASHLAAQHGFPKPDVHIPPTSGPFTGVAGYAEVIVKTDQIRYFSKVFGSDVIPVSARSVAQGRWTSYHVGILVLDPYAHGALTDTGNGTINVTGVPTIVNSNAADAATATGGGTVNSSEFDVTGVPGTSGSGTFIGTIHSGVAPTPDPLAYLPEPDPTTMPLESKKNFHLSNGTATISPGVYRGGITVSGQGSLIMEPGIYYMDGGGFTFTGQGSLNAVGVMIVNAPQSNSDVISISGTGAVTLSPMTTGIYAGISLWQVRSSTNTVAVSGGGGQTMTGTFYVAGGTLNVTGNGSNSTIGSQYISRLLTVNGGGSFNVNWNPPATARIRIITLAE